MRNQQIFEANSGFNICLLRFHFSMFEAKTGLKFEAVFGLKNRVGLYGFQACSGIFFVSAPMEPTGNWQSLMPKVWCRMMVCWLQTEPSNHKPGKSPGSTKALAVFALVG